MRIACSSAWALDGSPAFRMVEEIARRFFRQHTIYPFARPAWVAANRQWIAEQAHAYPGFAPALRRIALEALEAAAAAGDGVQVRRALGALAVVGRAEDLARIAAVGAASGGLYAKDARAAAYEIEHHEPTV